MVHYGKRLLVIGACVAMTGCAVYGLDVDGHAVVVDVAPPAPRTESPPPRPAEDYYWVSGYWYWTGSRHIWVSGSWRRPPAVGHVWVGGSWVVVDGRYRYVAGRWSAPARAPAYRYVHPRPVYRHHPVRVR